MKSVETIKGKPIIKIFESFNGCYWYVVEKAWTQDSLIDGKLYKQDQIYFGYARLSHCPQFAEWGYFSEAELRQLGNRIWEVRKTDWAVCPEVEVQDMPTEEPTKNKQPGESPAFHTRTESLERRWQQNG